MNLNPENKFSDDIFLETGYIKLYYASGDSRSLSSSYFKKKITKGYNTGFVVGHLKIVTNKLTNEIESCEVIK